MSAKPFPPELDALQSAGDVALFLDFDGTLVDIAPTPDGIAVPSGLVSSLHDLRDRLEGRLALVSGRAIVDLERHLGQLELVRAGSHGSDCRDAAGGTIGEAPGAIAEELRSEVSRFVEKHGLTKEDKPHGAALHYRSDPKLEDSVLEFARKLAEQHELELKRGKCVVELVARGANKGSAVHAIMQQQLFSGAKPIFVGDDVTDEDGMSAAQDYNGFGVLVGDRTPSLAKYGLATPAAVHHWLGL